MSWKKDRVCKICDQKFKPSHHAQFRCNKHKYVYKSYKEGQYKVRSHKIYTNEEIAELISRTGGNKRVKWG